MNKQRLQFFGYMNANDEVSLTPRCVIGFVENTTSEEETAAEQQDPHTNQDQQEDAA